MNIVLATPPELVGRWGQGSFPPLGLLYLAASVKHLPDVRVSLVDCYAEGLDVDQALERVVSLSPDVFGLSATSMTFEGGWQLLNRVKTVRRDVMIVLGGFHATLFDKVLLQEINEVDVVVRGEAEVSFRILCESLLGGHGIASISGISYRSNGEVVSGEPQRIEDLDALPFPDRSILEYDGYGTHWAGFSLPQIPRFATLVSSRGCIYNCTFCADKVLKTSRWRPRSPENVLQELLDLSDQGCELVCIVDENFAGDVRRVNTLCTMLKEEKLAMRFAIQCSLHNVPYSTMKLMHQAGCDVVFLGVESGSDAQLKRYNKPTGRRGMAAGVRRAKRANMFVVASFITGAPGEVAGDLEDTNSFVREIRPHVAETGPLRVHPGSRIWEDLVGKGEPNTVKETLSRRIDTFPGQTDTETLYGWIRDFRLNFVKTMYDWRRIPEILSLILHNPTVRKAIWILLSNPRIVLRFFGKTKTK